MMRLIDSHMHMDVFEAAGETGSLLDRARQNGVECVIAIGGRPAANETAIRISEAFDMVRAVVGYDRDEALLAPDIESLQPLVAHDRVVGVGECGLDYHYHPDHVPEQQALFEHMLDLAVSCARPVVVHSRDADEDTLRFLTAYAERWSGPGGVPGVLHCFTGLWPFARSLMDLGFMISFSGIVTFKKSEALREVARQVPDEFLLIETDAPYLAPVPHRGRQNEPAYVRHVAECLASIRGESPEEVAACTSRNARRLFRLDG